MGGRGYSSATSRGGAKRGGTYTFGDRTVEIKDWNAVSAIPGEKFFGSKEAVGDFVAEYNKHVSLTQEAKDYKIHHETDSDYGDYGIVHISGGFFTDSARYPKTGDAQKDAAARQAARTMTLNRRARNYIPDLVEHAKGSDVPKPTSAATHAKKLLEEMGLDYRTGKKR